jgi:DNA-binding MarR family transcriptional regulator
MSKSMLRPMKGVIHLKVKDSFTEGFRTFALIRETFQSLFEARRRELEHLDISVMQAAALWGIGYVGRPATVAELAQILGRGHHTTAQLLRRMKKQGLLTHQQGVYKNNADGWVLTKEGEEQLKNTLEPYEIIDQIVGCLSDQERNDLKKYLVKLRDAARTKTAVSPRFPELISSRPK